MNGILVINKPIGPTSHDIVDKVRHITGIKRVGHAGTLDPFAEGVLVILIGLATKLQSKFMEMPKTYVATLRLGATSDTYDKTGKIQETTCLPARQGHNNQAITKKQIQKILKQFVGEIKQMPPAFSAIKIKGKKAYELARKGIKPELKPRKVKIYDIQCRKYRWPASRRRATASRGGPYLGIEVKCGKGTYIRSLAHDIGQKLFCGAYLEKLVRTEVGKFNIKNSVKINKLTPSNWQSYLLKIN